MSYLINSRKVTTLIFEDIETNKTAVNGTLYYSKDDNLAGVGLQDGSIQRIPDGRCRGGVYTDLTDLNTNITDPAINDWAVVTDATGAIGTIDPNSKSYIVRWDSTNWEIIYTDTNDSAFVNYVGGAPSSIITNSPTADAVRTGLTRFNDTTIFDHSNLGAKTLNAPFTNSELARFVSVGFDTTVNKEDGYSPFGFCVNGGTGATPLRTADGRVVRFSFDPRSTIINCLRISNSDIGTAGTPATPDDLLFLNNSGQLQLPKYDGSGNFLATPSQITYLLAHDSAGNLVQIPKPIWRKFSTLSAQNIPNTGGGYTNLITYNFTVTNACTLQIIGSGMARQSSTGSRVRFRAAVSVNGGTDQVSVIELAVTDQAAGVGQLGGSIDMFLISAVAGDVITLKAQYGSNNGGGTGQQLRTDFVVIENTMLVAA